MPPAAILDVDVDGTLVDSTFDCEAAKRAGLETVPELRLSLDETPLARG